MSERLLTPSKITAWLECAHFLTLRNQVDAGLLSLAPSTLGPLAELLIEKGTSHERDCLSDFENQGRSIHHVSGRRPDETFAQWVTRIGNPMDQGHDVIYQMPFAHEGIRGIADFLVRVEHPDDGYAAYEPIDAKLTRSQGKPGHVLQLCFYSDAMRALTGAAPQQMHIWLGSGVLEGLVVEQFSPYWRRLHRQLSVLLNRDGPTGATSPEPCAHCEFCEFAGLCEHEWRQNDSLVYVAQLRPPERSALEDAGVRTLVQLSTRTSPVPSLHEESRTRLVRQAALQVRSRAAPDEAPAFEVIEETEDPVYGHGFSLLPPPDDGDVFFDFEGHPFWTPQVDLFFLAGLYLVGVAGQWGYDGRWAHDLEQQRDMIHELVSFFAARRQQFPGMHVYHYNHTERSSLERLTRGTESERLFVSLVESGLFVDLFSVARNALQVGTESYGLKHLERLTSYERSGDIEGGAGAVVEYERWMATGDPRLLEEIAGYNCDDVRATKALRDWLVAQRPADLGWRDVVLETEDHDLDTDELVASLSGFGEQSPEHLLGELLNYWRRERSANTTPKFVAMTEDYGALYPDGDFIANLSLVAPVEDTINRNGNEQKRAAFTWPVQEVSVDFTKGTKVLFTGVGVEQGFGYVVTFDRDHRELTMTWSERHDEVSGVPAVISVDGYFSAQPKPGVLIELAQRVVASSPDDPPSRVAMELLGRAEPRFLDVRLPRDGVFRDDVDSMLEWVGHLDASYVAIQGPPGTGKTYSGARIIHSLINSGKRVGITAMSHAAIDNLLEATHAYFEEQGALAGLRAVRVVKKPKDGGLPGVRYNPKAAELENDDFNLVAGTTWLWSRASLRPFPVDVLVVDEAGQLSLADTIAATNAASNLILLGDPLQLAQVSQAEHPGGSGASVLEHVLGEQSTIPDTNGVFIGVTRRMHPDICGFISRQIYEGRLTSHESCAQQATEFGTGLRWLAAHHSSRSTESPEEVAIVARQILAMLGTTWVDNHGASAPLRASDFMVVAPYNDQVRLLETTFASVGELRGVQVGTVDKFQGREAPVVFFTMTTSTSDDMPRGPEFLFSRNRLNVAVSRARCLAYLVCTEELLNSRAHSIDEMRLIGTLSAFVEYATAPMMV